MFPAAVVNAALPVFDKIVDNIIENSQNCPRRLELGSVLGLKVFGDAGLRSVLPSCPVE